MGEAKRRKQLYPDTYGKPANLLIDKSIKLSAIPKQVYEYALHKNQPGLIIMEPIKHFLLKNNDKIKLEYLSIFDLKKISKKSNNKVLKMLAHKAIILATITCDFSQSRLIVIDEEINIIDTNGIIKIIEEILRFEKKLY